MSVFVSCKGLTACRDDGTRCLTCGRSLDEIARTRALIDALAEFVCAQGYDNVEEFSAYVVGKVGKKVRARRAEGSSPD